MSQHPFKEASNVFNNSGQRQLKIKQFKFECFEKLYKVGEII